MNEESYLMTLDYILTRGTRTSDRTGTDTIRYPGVSMRFDLDQGYPILTTKKVMFYPMLVELLWFLQGRNDLEWLQDRKCNIWNQWHDENHTIGRGYGVQWRKWSKGAVHSIDQIANLIDGLKNNPNSRRHLVSAWNVAELDQMALPPCHFSFQFVVIGKDLHCILNQRSGDMFLGVPFNIASYSLLTELLAKECGLKAKSLTHNIGDAHIYSNHVEQVKTQLEREPKPFPQLVISDEVFPEPWEGSNEHRGLLFWLDRYCKELSLEQIKELFYLEGYDPHPFIKAPVAV